MDILLEILRYTIPGIVVLIACSIIVRRFLLTEIRRKQFDLLRESQGTTTRLRLQAYERLAVFIERINPRYLIPRVYESGMRVKDLRAAIQLQINAEFEHNLSQQIYVSRQVWETVKGVKEQELTMVHQLASQLSPDAPAQELHKKIIEFVATADSHPTELALNIIHDEAKHMLFRGLRD